MPSPFPGMDPFLEAPAIWPDFHDACASEIRAELNRRLPSPYYARLEMRPEVGIVETDITRRIIPDVAVVRTPRHRPAAAEGGVALLDGPRTEVSAWFEVLAPAEPLRHMMVEIRDPQRGHALVTLIEIVSPSNKWPGVDRRAYQAKQQSILDSEASLVEIDLLRGGEPLVGGDYVTEALSKLEARPDYLIAVNRAWRRGANIAYQLFAVDLTEPLPCIPVPLREHDADVPLDLQYVFQRAYDSGPYCRGAVDYTTTPDPPLAPERLPWMQERLRTAGLLPS